MNCIQSLETAKVPGETISRRTVSGFYVQDTVKVGRITELMVRDTSIEALGVVDVEMKALGFIERNELLNLVGQKFGRELFENRPVREIMSEAPRIYYRRNTYSVIDEMGDKLQSGENIYYIITDEKDRYRGLVSSSEIIRFLSRMMTDDINRARGVQKAIVKEDTIISNENFSFCGSTRMAGGIGGDYYYIKETGKGEWNCAICDVSGKGIKASLISVALGGMFNAFDFSRGLKTFIKELNNYIYGLFQGEIFITGIFYSIEPETGRCTLYDMGHSLLYLIRDKKIFRLRSEGENLPVGIAPDPEPIRSCIDLGSGEILVSITDGFIEQTNSANEQLGENRFLSLLIDGMSSGISAMKDNIYREIKNYKFGQAQIDDMTIIMMEKKQP